MHTPRSIRISPERGLASYRIQLHAGFRFADLLPRIPYLDSLGVTAIYASPILEAVPGSTHGYDGTNPLRINPEIGTLEELRLVSLALQKRSMAWIQDIVPNHMAFHQSNRWLMDTLEKGPESPYAACFDIDWEHPAHRGKLMAPFPGSSLENYLHKKIPAGRYYALCDREETSRQINYRRFFTVDGLIGLRMEDPAVFERYHSLIFRCVEEGLFQGLRIDHIDGLADPAGYLQRLRERLGDQIWIGVEKILEPEESLPAHWPVQGTTGYDFLGAVNSLLTRAQAKRPFSDFYQSLTGEAADPELLTAKHKAHILDRYMCGEWENLVRLYEREAAAEGLAADHSSLRDEVAAYLIDCPVYRYYPDQPYPLLPRDAERPPGSLRRFYARCMQFSGPLMAKGVEDTLFYTFCRQIGNNEVGDSPFRFGLSAAEFHAMMFSRGRDWPQTMNATATHDTKRGEDARARLQALTTLHAEWLSLAGSWMEVYGSLKTGRDMDAIPDARDTWFILQTLASSYPWPRPGKSDLKDYSKRLEAYLEKALREAKRHTSWGNPDTEYEIQTKAFVRRLLQHEAFQSEFGAFMERLAPLGMQRALAQLVLRLTCPGIPDTYQGTEGWDFSFVDPDNRRPVDYEIREQLLKHKISWPELWRNRQDGRIKLKLLQQLLWIRKCFPRVFGSGRYVPLECRGRYAGNLLAYLRAGHASAVLVAVPLHHPQDLTNPANPLGADWEDTEVLVPPGFSDKWTAMTGEHSFRGSAFPASGLFRELPLAVLFSGKELAEPA